MPRFVIAGGSVAGLSSALALARAGFEVTVLERDPIPVAPDPEAAFAVERPGAPQTHFLHAFLARMVLVLRERFPDLLAALEEAGASVRRPPEDLGDGLGLLLARRSTVEWVLRRAVLAEPGVDVRTGQGVAALLARSDPPVPGRVATDGVPVVEGVILEDGSTMAGTVVACTGRRGDVPGWLGPLGIEIPEQVVQSDLLYTTRWYATDDQPAPAITLRDLGFLTYLVVPADGGTAAVAIGVPPSDHELRACLLEDAAFDRLVGQLPELGQFWDSARPIRPVRPMAGLVNRLRSFSGRDGAPRVLGFHAAGDAHTCTNPAYGRGCSLAFVQATLLADAAAAHPDDPRARAVAYEAACAREIEPWFHNSVLMDSARRSARHDGKGGGGGPGGQVLRALVSGAIDEPGLRRGLIRMFHLLLTPEELLGDPAFTGRLATLVANPPTLPAAAAGPTREEVLAAATAA